MAYEQYIKKHRIQTSRVVPDQANREIAQGWKNASELTNEVSNSILEKMATTSKQESATDGQNAFTYTTDELGRNIYKRTPMPEGVGSIYSKGYLEAQDRTMILNYQQALKAEAQRLLIKYKNDPKGIEKYRQEYTKYSEGLIKGADDKRIEGTLIASSIQLGTTGLNGVIQNIQKKKREDEVSQNTVHFNNSIAALTNLAKSGDFYNNDGTKSDLTKTEIAKFETAKSNLISFGANAEDIEKMKDKLLTIEYLGETLSKLKKSNPKNDPYVLLQKANDIITDPKSPIPENIRVTVANIIQQQANTQLSDRELVTKKGNFEFNVAQKKYNDLELQRLRLTGKLTTVLDIEDMLAASGLTKLDSARSKKFQIDEINTAIASETKGKAEINKIRMSTIKEHISIWETDINDGKPFNEIKESFDDFYSLARTTEERTLLRNWINGKTTKHLTTALKSSAKKRKLNIEHNLRTNRITMEDINNKIESDPSSKDAMFLKEHYRSFQSAIGSTKPSKTLTDAFRIHRQGGNLNQSHINALFEDIGPVENKDLNKKTIDFSNLYKKLPSDFIGILENNKTNADYAKIVPLIQTWDALSDKTKSNLLVSNPKLYSEWTNISDFAQSYGLGDNAVANWKTSYLDKLKMTTEQIEQMEIRGKAFVTTLAGLDNEDLNDAIEDIAVDLGWNDSTAAIEQIFIKDKDLATNDPIANSLTNQSSTLGISHTGLFDEAPPTIKKNTTAYFSFLDLIRKGATDSNLQNISNEKEYNKALITKALKHMQANGFGATFYSRHKQRMETRPGWHLFGPAYSYAMELGFGNFDKDEMSDMQILERLPIERYLNHMTKTHSVPFEFRDVFIKMYETGTLSLPKDQVVTDISPIDHFFNNPFSKFFHNDPENLNDNGSLVIEYATGDFNSEKGPGYYIYARHPNRTNDDPHIGLVKDSEGNHDPLTIFYPKEFIMENYIRPKEIEMDKKKKERNVITEDLLETGLPL